MTYGVADVMNLRAVTFEQKNEYPSNTYAGFIAEEVHDAGLVEFVEYNDAGQPDAVHYGNMVSLLTKAIQEQQATIASLTTRIEQLEAN
jgi:coenzyme F420-reducing hydrogenase alpha subunit